MNAVSDEQLLQEFVAGRLASFELLVRRHTPELHQFVLRFTGDTATAEDVTQEAFLKVYHSASMFETGRRFKPWLFTIAANKARDHLRRRQRLREYPIDAKVDESGDSQRRFVDLFADADPDADQSLSVDDRRRAVRRAVEVLPDKLREILILAYYLNLPYRDIATITDVPVGTVKSRLHAAVRTFRLAYEKLACPGNEPPRSEGS